MIVYGLPLGYLSSLAPVLSPEVGDIEEAWLPLDLLEPALDSIKVLQLVIS